MDPAKAIKKFWHGERMEGVKFAEEQMKLGRMVVDFGFTDLHHILIAYEGQFTLKDIKDGSSWVPELICAKVTIMKYPEDLP